MIEEILTSLTKLTDMKKNRRQYSLRNGKGIHSINALLLQLIQAASHGVADYLAPQQTVSLEPNKAKKRREKSPDEPNADTGEGRSRSCHRGLQRHQRARQPRCQGG